MTAKEELTPVETVIEDIEKAFDIKISCEDAGAWLLKEQNYAKQKVLEALEEEIPKAVKELWKEWLMSDDKIKEYFTKVKKKYE